MTERTIDGYRYFLKDSIRKEIEFRLTDQSQGKAPPPLQKPPEPGKEIFDLPDPSREFLERFDLPLSQAILRRMSVRQFSDESLTIDELSFLLWATQGVRAIMGNTVSLRTVPSAGARHSLETYLAIMNVSLLDGEEGGRERVGGDDKASSEARGRGGRITGTGMMTQGIYRYLPLTHQLVLEARERGLGSKLGMASLGQRFVGEGAVTFIWTTIPYRMEWRYGLAAHKVIAIDAGHVCQNLYLACEAVGAGTSAIGAYDQGLMDELLDLDGTNGEREEFVVYLAPVGKKR
jgi:SagB-type dehydrogenase family enzyme